MSLWETDPQFFSETDPAALLQPAEVAPDETEQARPATATARWPGLLLRLGLLFCGLLVGWLIIGWWLWPVEWTNTHPWDMRADHQRTYVDLVAQDYWQTGDVARARQTLAGWDQGDLAKLVATMRAEATDPGARQRLIALSEALALPDYQASPLSALLSHELFLPSLLVAVVPLALAIALGVTSLVRDRARQTDELLAQAAEQAADGATQQPDELSPPEAALDDGEGDVVTTEMADSELGQTQETDDGDEDEDWWEEDEEESDGASVGDILTSLFEEESSALPQLEALAKGLPDVEIGALAQQSQRMAKHLRQSNQLRVASPD